MKRPLSFFCLSICIILCSITLIKNDKYRSMPTESPGFVGLTGTIYSINYKSKNGIQSQTVILKNVHIKGFSAPARGVLCYMSTPYNDIHLGQSIYVEGDAKAFEKATNLGQFDQMLYYNTLKIDYALFKADIISSTQKYSRIKDFFFRMRRFFSGVLDDALPEKEAAIMKTMLLGEKGELDSELKDLYQRNGIAHVLAISGLHISLLGLGIFKLVKRLPLPPLCAYILSSLLVFFYGMITGFSVSAIRAVFMFIVSMLALCFKRSYDALTAVSLSAFLILIGQPLYIFHSGFVFSFGCVFGIILIMPLLSPETSAGRKLGFIKRSLLSALSMTVINLPIYYIFFYQVPVYSILLNFLIIPVMAVLVPSGIMLILFSGLKPILASPFRILITGILGLFQSLAEVSDSLPGHFYTPGKPAAFLIIIYIILLIFIVIYKEGLSLSKRWVLCLLGAVLLSVRFNGGLNIHFLDVGQGDSIVISYASSPVSIPGITKEYHFLVDGGSSSVSSPGKYRMVPFLQHQGIMTLEAVFVTHPDEDHVCGIKELLSTASTEGIKIKELIMGDIAEGSKSEGYYELINLAKEMNIPVAYISSGDSLILDKRKHYRSGPVIRCVFPDKGFKASDENEASTVLLISYNDFSCLLTGDIEGAGEEIMAQNLSALKKSGIISPKINILKAAHHGSKNSGSEEILKQIFSENEYPKVAIISCGKNNRYGHPHGETLERLYKYIPTTKILRTDKSGQITVTVDNDKILIRHIVSNIVHSDNLTVRGYIPYNKGGQNANNKSILRNNYSNVFEEQRT